MVEKYGIGITINHLKELEPCLASVTDDTYQGYLDNLVPLSLKSCKGGFLVDAIELIENRSSVNS